MVSTKVPIKENNDQAQETRELLGENETNISHGLIQINELISD